MLVDPAGRVLTGLADGRIVRIDPDGRVETIVRVPGRPLGLKFLGDDEQVVCASEAGLLAISPVGVRVLVERVAGRRLGRGGRRGRHRGAPRVGRDRRAVDATGVREAGGVLWLGSLHGTAVATLPVDRLDQARP